MQPEGYVAWSSAALMHRDIGSERNRNVMITKVMKSLPRLRISSPLQIFLVHVVLSLLFGAVWYLVLYGHFHLHFTHVNWIYKAGGDVLQHQLGWEWFRQEPWQFPLGTITAYGYPFGYLSHLYGFNPITGHSNEVNRRLV